MRAQDDTILQHRALAPHELRADEAFSHALASGRSRAISVAQRQELVMTLEDEASGSEEGSPSQLLARAR